MNDQTKEPSAGAADSTPMTLDDAERKWRHLSDTALYKGVDEQRQEPYAGIYRMGRRGVTDADLLQFLAETEHLPTWDRLSPGKTDARLFWLSPENLDSRRLEGRTSPYTAAETVALALRSGKITPQVEDFRIGQRGHAEAMERKASLPAAQVGAYQGQEPPRSSKPPKPAAIVRAALSKTKGQLRPTEEQAAAVAAFSTGASLKIIAGAGTGKTSTLKLAAESTGRRGVYLAFNTAMADEAKRRMPGNVRASTAHSMAFRAVDPGFRNKIGQRLPARMAAEAAGVRNPVELPGKNKEGKPLVISQAAAGYFMLDWVRRHCMGATPNIMPDSAPAARMLSVMGIAREDASPEDWKRARDVSKELLLPTEKLWARMSNPRDVFPATHDTYLKVWAVSGPKIDADFILFDEAQDANALMLQIVEAQSAQKIFVGDPNQQIYAWRGAVNAMQSIQTEQEARLTESFRFGPEVAEFANLALDLCGSDMRLSGKAPTGREHGGAKPLSATICRTNAEIIEALLFRPDISRVHVAGGTTQIVGLLDGMRELRDTDRTSNPELMHFKSWAELAQHAQSESDDLSALFKLSKEGETIEGLSAMLKQTSAIARPDSHVLSTAHKCKGLEWADVHLAKDFRDPGHKRWSQEEANLLYVAGTRGMRSLSLDDRLAEKLGSKTSYREPGAKEPEQKKQQEKPAAPAGADKCPSPRRSGSRSTRGWPFPASKEAGHGL